MRHRGSVWTSTALMALAVVLILRPNAARAQESGEADALAQRVNERVATLQAEAARLAAQARTLLGDLRQLEIQRDIQAERVKQADADVDRAQMALDETQRRLAALEEERVASLPDLKLRLANLYMQGRGGYARMLVDARSAREFARAMRALMALTTVTEQRIEEHRQTLAKLAQERDELGRLTRELQASAAAAQRERQAADRAVRAREALLAQIDARRDLNAQLTGELQISAERLQAYVASLAAGTPAEPVSVPLTAFQGGLPWPVAGRVVPAAADGPDGQARSGITIAAPEGQPVVSVHDGTVDYAEPFTGFGNLVIIDHGSNCYSLYGYLDTIEVSQGTRIPAGTVVGRVGSPPVGSPALYFELRVDGRSVNPVQWLKPR